MVKATVVTMFQHWTPLNAIEIYQRETTRPFLPVAIVATTVAALRRWWGSRWVRRLLPRVGVDRCKPERFAVFLLDA